MSFAENLSYRCIPRFITHDHNLPHQARYLFVILAQEIDLDTGKLQTTYDYLAEISGMSISTILRNLPLLEAKGYIRVNRARKGSKIPNTYEIGGIARLIVVINTKLCKDENLRRRK